MKYVRPAFPFIPLVGAVLLFAVIIAWQPDTTKASGKKYNATHNADTTPPKPADIDKIDLQLNLDSVMRQVDIELSKIDYAKMNVDIQKAMSQIDYSKMNMEINKAMKEIDWSKMKMDVSKAIDSAKMAVDKINWDEMKANISHAQAEAKKGLAEQKLNTETIRMQVQKSLQDAQRSLQSAQVELINYKDLKAALQKDGLIENGKPYHIQLKEGMLFINGAKQSKAVTDKYNRFYPNKKSFTISDGEGADL